MTFLQKFKNSALELRSVRCICVTGVLIAMSIAISYFSIKIGDTVKITFGFIPRAAIGMLFGPVVGFISGTVTDIVSTLIKPDGAFNFLYTVVEAVGGMLYGIFLYGLKPVSFKGEQANKRTNVIQVLKVIFSKISVVVICNLILTPAAHILSGWWTIDVLPVKYPASLIKNAIQCPVDCVLLVLILFPILLAYRKVFGYRNSAAKDNAPANADMKKA